MRESWSYKTHQGKINLLSFAKKGSLVLSEMIILQITLASQNDSGNPFIIPISIKVA